MGVSPKDFLLQVTYHCVRVSDVVFLRVRVSVRESWFGELALSPFPVMLVKIKHGGRKLAKCIGVLNQVVGAFIRLLRLVRS